MTSKWHDAVPTRQAWITAPVLSLAGLIAGLIATGWFFLTRPSGQVVDQLALLGARDYPEHGSGKFRGAAYDALVAVTMPVRELAEIWVVIVAAVIVLAVAAAQRKWLLRSPRSSCSPVPTSHPGDQKLWSNPCDLYQTYGNSWPSGHTTLVATACSPSCSSPRALALGGGVLGSVATTFMAWATILSGWHRPSDTVAAILVSAIWYVLVEIARRSVAPVPLTAGVRSPVAIRILDILSGICAALGIGILAATLLTLPDSPVADMEVAIQRLAFVGAFFGVAAIALGTNRVLLTVGPHED